MYRIGFVIEQTLGHVTYGQNLKKNVSSDPEIDDHWIFPSWQTQGLASYIPIYNDNWTIHAGLQARFGLADMSRQVSLDGLFFHTQVPAILSRKWVRRFPTVISMDATPMQYDRLGDYYKHGMGPSWLEKKKWQLNVGCFHEAKHLVTWSEWAKQGLINEYDILANKITVIPLGVNLAEWVRPRLHVSPRSGDPVRILFVGGQLDRKGGNLLLEAYRQLRYRYHESMLDSVMTNAPEIELHMVTKDDLDSEPGVYVYNDMRPNSKGLKDLFYKCDIFCLPSYGDFLPMVLAEAGAAGLPSVTTKIAAIPEIIQDGISGILVSPGDREGLENALQNLIFNRQLRIEMGENARKFVSKAFAAETNAQKLLDLLKCEIIKAA